MAEIAVYQQLAEMIGKEDVVGMPVTPSLLKIVSLQFTPEEAELALRIHLKGGTLDELAAKTGWDRERLKFKLLEMADKGTIIYDPAEADPVYRVVGMTAGGLTETGVWGGLRFPFTAELGRALFTMMAEHAELALARLGFPYTPVWAAKAALPPDAQPSEDLTEVVKAAGHWSVSLCPCRFSRSMARPDDPCKHTLQTCVHTGPLSRWAVKHGMARELTHEELVDLLRRCNEDGLVHTINLLGQICNCCNDCCGIFHTFNMGVPTFIPSPFVPAFDERECTGCGECRDLCPVRAITVEDTASVNRAVCIGCGVCVTHCPSKAITLVRR